MGAGRLEAVVAGASKAQTAAGDAAWCASALSAYRRAKPAPHPVSVTLTFAIIAAIIYGNLLFGLGGVFLPNNAPFAVLVIWVVAIGCADIAAWLRLPRVVGMLLGGLLLENVPDSPIAAFPSIWGSQMRAAGLATIYLRCGLVLEWQAMKQYKVAATKLALIPGLVEMCFDAGVAVAVFGMPVLLAFTLGSMLQAVGPALLVPLLFGFQQKRMGTHEGIPQSAIVAASFDDIVAITWFSIFSCLAITGQSNIGWDIARGPVQVVLGVVAGVVLGAGLAFTRLWDTQRKRLIATFFSGLLIMFVLFRFNMLSGGALGALVLGMVAAALWRRGWPRHAALGLGPAPHFSDDLEAAIAEIWDWVAEPIIFGTIGASINFSALPAGVAARAALIVLTGLAVRVIATFLTMYGQEGRAGDHPYSFRSRLFFAVAWTPKATVQAVLSGTPLHLVKILKSGAPDYDQWLQWGHEIQTTGVICILICATLGTLLVQVFGPKLLDEAPKAEEERECLTALAAKADSDALLLANPQSVQGSAFTALLLQYFDLSRSLRIAVTSDAAEDGAAAADAAARGAAGGAAAGLKQGQQARRRGAARGAEGIADELLRLEESLRLHIQVAPLSVRRALELDTTAFLDAVKESHDLESRGLTPAEPPPASRVVPRPPQPPAAAAGRDA